jgi:hypothetical protein
MDIIWILAIAAAGLIFGQLVDHLHMISAHILLSPNEKGAEAPLVTY